MDRRAIVAHCQPRTLDTGDRLEAAQNAPICFPEDAIVSLVDGQDRAIGMVGAEGMTAWSVLLRSHAHAVSGLIERGGRANMLPYAALMALCRDFPVLRSMVLSFVELAAAQMLDALLSMGEQVEVRLCRVLLMLHDRTAGDALTMTHLRLSRQLGIRRASVTNCLHLLEGERLLRSRRNSIEIQDRAALERHAGSAYGGAERAYRAALGPFGKGPAD